MQTLKKLMAAVWFVVLALSIQAQPVPVKVGSLTPVTTAAPNYLIMLTVPGVTNYVITFQNLQNQISVSLGTNSVIISNAYVTYLTATNLLVLDTLTVNSNAYIGGTNFANYLVVTNPPWAGISNYVDAGFVTLSNQDISFFQSSTNYANGLWTLLSNVDYAVFTVLSNQNTASFLSASNYAFSLWNGWPTNHSITLATNTTQANLDFSGTYQTVEVPDLLETNIVLVTTNLVAGREMWVNFQAPSCTYFVTITNTDGYAVHWNLNSTTNGFTSFAVTNGFGTELAIKCYSNNVIKAVYGHNL